MCVVLCSVHVHLCVCECIYVQVTCVNTRGWLSVALTCIFWGSVSCWIWNSVIPLIEVASLPRRSLSLTPEHWDYSWIAASAQLCMWVLGSRLWFSCVYEASPLTTELSSQCSYANLKMQKAFSSASHTLCFSWLPRVIMTMVSYLCLTETHQGWNTNKDGGWMCMHVALTSVTLEHVFMNGIYCHDGNRVHIN